MNTARRVLSGNLAAWCGISINLLTQLFLIPLYLSHWSKQTYGVWITLQSLITLLEVFDYGHQGFLQNEFLRIGIKRRRFLRKVFWSSTVIGLGIGLIQAAVVIPLCTSGLLPKIIGISQQYIHSFIVLIIANIVIWWLTGSVLGISVRLFDSIGYYSRFAWWRVLGMLISSILPSIAVALGGGLEAAGLVQVVGYVLYNIPLFLYKWKLLHRENMLPVRPDLRLGLRNLGRAQVITGTTLLDMVRQDGIRILLAPLAGAGATASFATMRTGANVIQQGVGTVTGPIMPELMRCLNRSDQARSEAFFGTIWMVIIVVMAPGAILLQFAAPSLFVWWTRGKIDFDPTLFAILTFSVLIYATSQPAVAVVQGNNILGARLTLSLLTGGCIIGGMFLLIPIMGIRGVALVLLIAEAISAIGYTWQAAIWMSAHRMRWPQEAFRWIIASIGTTGIALASCVGLPHYQLFLAIGALTIQVALMAGYWRTLPSFARMRVADTIETRLPLLVGKRLANSLR